MLTSIRNCTIRWLLPLAWRHHPGRAALALRRFGDTEADSGWQYLCALGHAQDPALQRMLFSNVLEELRHADYFLAAAHQLATRRLHLPAAARQRLVRSPADLPYFLAYAHECERSIHGQFDAFAAACHMPEVAEVFRRISEDEQTHESEALGFLHRSMGEEVAVVRRWVRRAKWARLYEAWMRGSQRMGDAMFGLVLSAVFFAFGPCVAWPLAGTSPNATPQPAPGGGARRWRPQRRDADAVATREEG
ncbi:hypothetical protein [Ideonella sp.]|uniref:hypothetical protein n=1 Tax=Ideonella sp. TaxID=1929293 RepID=UPI0035B4434D